MAEPIRIETPTQDEMLMAVGRGIQAFASVELGLSHVFAAIMVPADTETSIIALDAARHIETKMRIVHAVSNRLADDDLKKRCHNALNRIKRRTEVRHKLAHWTVSYWPGVTTPAGAKKLKVALVPPPASPGYIETVYGNAPPVHLHEIENFINKCVMLSRDLYNLSAAINYAQSSA